MSLHGYWRPPWETMEAEDNRGTESNNGGYYAGGQQSRGCGAQRQRHQQQEARHHYPREGGGGGGGGSQRIDYPRARTQREQYQQRHRDPGEYYYGGSERRTTTRWDDDGYTHDSTDQFDGYYPPPTNHAPRASQRDLYFNDRLAYHHQDQYCERGRAYSADVAYGVGLPVSGDSSPPPLTITDDSSNDSLRHAGGGSSLDDAFDGYNNGRNHHRRNNAESPSTLSRGVDSVYADDVVSSSPPPAAAPKRTMIEIMPGVKMLLRGAKETWEAFQRKFYVTITCIGCSTKVFCIQDADYVLCPVCRVVSPLEVISKPSQWRIGGLGLGFTGEQDLCSSQHDREKMKIAQMSKP